MTTIQLHHAGLADLPVPTRTDRFVPLRFGIHQAWQYDDVFVFEDGWLLLRGHNGSGKSMALGLTQPFLIDGRLDARRLDTFGTAGGRAMRDILLERARHDARTAYLWFEYGRLDPLEGPVYVTAGAGLRARRTDARIDAWYFITDLRAGAGLSFVDERRSVLPRAGLKAALTGHGDVYDTAGDFRRAVDQRLFALGGGLDRLVDTLLELRKPKLSASLRVGEVARHLTRSLPPLDESILRDVAGAFDKLDADARDLQQFRQADEHLGSFLGAYRGYAKRVLQHAAAQIRQATSAYEDAGRQLVAARRDADEADDRVAAADVRVAELEREIETLEAEAGALLSSPAMQDYRHLQQARDTAARWAERLAAAREEIVAFIADAEESGTLLAASLEAVAEARESLARQRAALAAAARPAGLDVAVTAADGLWESDPLTARHGIDGAVTRMERALAELRALAAEAAAAGEQARRAREVEEERQQVLDLARDRRNEAGRGADAAQEVLHEELARWSGGLIELRLDGAALAAIDERANSAARGGTPLTAVVTQLAAPTRAALGAEEARALSRIDACEQERADLMRDREEVEARRQEAPAPLHRDPAAREGRQGAPFYALVDFAGDVGDPERAALEAAVEASGLLDAWVDADGAVLAMPDAPLDRLLSAGDLAPPASGRTLADVLVPVAGTAVSTAAVEGVLRRIAVGEHGAPVAVGLDGRWRVGPLSGRWDKPFADYIGATARERARERRLADIARRIDEIDRVELAAARVALESVLARLERLAAEIERVPSTAGLQQALVVLEERRHAEGEAEAALEAAAAARARREQEQVAARERLEHRALELGIGVSTGSLDDLRHRLAAMRTATVETVRAAEAHRSATASAARNRVQRDAAQSRLQARREQLADFETSTSQAAAVVRGLDVSIGSGAEEARRRYDAAVTRRDTARRELRGAQLTARENAEARARARELASGLERTLAERSDARDSAAAFVRTVGAAGIIAAAHPDLAGDDEQPAAAWSTTRCLDLARRVDIPPETLEARKLPEPGPVLTRLADLQALLVPYEPAAEVVEGGVVVVTASFSGDRVSIGRLQELVAAEIAERELNLARDEREAIERYLLDELGDHLRDRIADATARNHDINALLREHPTAGGVRLELVWKVREDLSTAGTADAVRLLGTNIHMLDGDERSRLVEWLRHRVTEARAALTGSWEEHLAAAFDYRDWHEYSLRLHQRDHPTRTATDQYLSSLSGGERAVVLHLPLFAAAAALYDAALPTAPRLILLDEAFDGLDEDMRARCCDILAKLDLDVFMTNCEMWATYKEVSGIAIYNLTHFDDMDGVSTLRWRWDGETLHEPDEM